LVRFAAASNCRRVDIYAIDDEPSVTPHDPGALSGTFKDFGIVPGATLLREVSNDERESHPRQSSTALRLKSR
jgi:hypothetical protein